MLFHYSSVTCIAFLFSPCTFISEQYHLYPLTRLSGVLDLKAHTEIFINPLCLAVVPTLFKERNTIPIPKRLLHPAFMITWTPTSLHNGPVEDAVSTALCSVLTGHQGLLRKDAVYRL